MNKVIYTHKITISSILTKLAIVHFQKNIRKNKKINDRSWASFNSDFIGIHLNAYPYYEYIELQTCFSFLSKFDLNFHEGEAIDIGANIGNHTLYFSERFLHVNAFEINSRTYELLDFNTREINNISTFMLGLSDKNEIVRFRQDNLNVGHGKIVDDSEDNKYDLEFKVNTLDSQDLQLTNLKLIKIDVEGHEFNVLKGAISTIQKFKPVILFELSIEDFKNGVPNSIDLLEKNGYFIFVNLIKNNNVIIRYLRVIKELILMRRNEVIKQIKGKKILPNNYNIVIAVHKDTFNNNFL
jgi:FkbM family methyltransferase